MSIISRFEDSLENVVEGAAGAVFKSPVEPAQIAKRAEKEMRREKLIGAGHQYAPTLYNVLIAPEDDERLGGFYPTMAAELETFLIGSADENGLDLICRPLVRFIVDDTLKQGKFEVIAENVAGEIVEKLRSEEMELYGLAERTSSPPAYGVSAALHDAGNLRAPVVDNGMEARFSAGRGASALAQVPNVAGFPNEGEVFGGIGIPSGAGAFAAADAFERAGKPAEARVPAKMESFGDSEGTYMASSAEGETALFNHKNPRGATLLRDISTGKTYPICQPRTIIGREQGVDVVIPDSNISRRHAELAWDPARGWTLRDLGSTNGTFVNRNPVSQALLHNGDTLTLGITILEFQTG